MSGQQPPPYPGPYGEQPPPGQQPPGQPPPPYPGPPAQPPPYTGPYGQPSQQPPYPGQQPPYPGQRPPYPGQQPPYPGQPQYPGYPQYPAPPRPEPPGSTAKLIGWLLALTGVVIAVAAFLTWWTGEAGSQSRDFRGLGFQDIGPLEVGFGDGVLTLILAVVAIGFAVARGFGALSLATAIIGVVAGTLITLVAIADAATDDPIRVEGPNGDTVSLGDGIEWSIGIGLWMTLLAGAAMLLLSIVGIIKRR